jgi:hypothetical protein
VTPATEATVAPSSFAAPTAIGPIGLAIQPGQSIEFRFASVGPLAGTQCYRIDMTLTHPSGPGGVGDYWTALCGDQSAAGTPLTFLVGRFTDAPNYITVLANAESIIEPSPNYTMRWSVEVVNILDAADPIHPQTEAISPASSTLENTFFR